MRLSLRSAVISCLSLVPLAPVSAEPYTFSTYQLSISAVGFNDVGQIIGTGGPLGSSGIYDVNTGLTTYFSFPNGRTTYAIGINDSRQIVGTAPDDVSTNAFLRDPVTGAFTNVSPPSGPRFSLSGINDPGQILSGRYLRDPVTGQYSDIGYSAAAFNDVGQFVGNIGQQGFFFDQTTGAYLNINYPGSVQTTLRSINNSEQIVGSYKLSNARSSPEFSFVYDEKTGIFTNLSNPDFNTLFAIQINNEGQILGLYSTGASPSFFTFIATPEVSMVPEPSTLALLGAGVMGLSIARRRRSSQQYAAKSETASIPEPA